MLKNLWFATGLTVLVLSTVTAQAPTEPPDLKPSVAVQLILDEASQLAQTKQLEKALAASDRALVAARAGKDAVGEAQTHRLRARALQNAGRAENEVPETVAVIHNKPIIWLWPRIPERLSHGNEFLCYNDS